MYFDFEDYRPDVPRVPQAISRREGVLMAFSLHLVVLLLVVMFPGAFQSVEEVVEALPLEQQQDAPRFVYIAPMVERPAPPPPRAPLSDLDRRASSPVVPPAPPTPDPFAVGNTPERVIGTPEERRAGPDGPGAAPVLQPTPPGLPGLGTTPLPRPTEPTPPAGGGRLGDSLRNLQQYLQNETFDNRRGGQSDQDPLIQFDSKGVEFGPWVRRFRAQVKRNWYIPEAARLLSGRVSIRFRVHRDGRLTAIDVIRPSAVEQFTAAAANALRLSNPTVPLPEEYPDDSIEIVVTFLYNVDR
ncbi:MAG TPA: TonB family protein [Vicinamibacterales bacterium]|nr:TonB family protein [Vicinamibacterales bacterium]